MPFTYSWRNLIDLTKEFGHGIPTTAIEAQCADFVSSRMWTYYPWRWTLTNISPNTPLVDAQQDYTAPTNFYRWGRVRIVRTDTTPDQAYTPLDPVEQLEPEYTSVGLEQIRQISLDYPTGLVRLNAPPSIATGVVAVLHGDFQMNPVKLTSANLTTNIWFPDQYAPVAMEGITYYIYRLTDDTRAGNMVIAPKTGQVQYTGQLGVFMDALVAMAVAEETGETPSMFPANPLGAGKIGGWRGLL